MGSELCPNLATQLAALKEVHSSPQSDSTIHSSLSLFLSIYLKSHRLCNQNYMEGAEILYNWLAPHSTLPLLSNLPRVPQIFRTYELAYLAKIISPDTSSDTWLTKRRIVEDIIYHKGTEI